MAQDNSGAVSAVQSVSSKSNVGNVGSDTEGLPSQKSVDIATDLAAEFKQPDEKIPAIAQAVEGLLNGKTQADRVDSFKKLAELLGIDVGKEKGGAEESKKARGQAQIASSRRHYKAEGPQRCRRGPSIVCPRGRKR